jgi:DNA-binding transcriptional MerR regulator
MNMKELLEAAGGGQVTARFVRFLVSEGVIPPPTGGRAHATYDERHLHGVVNYGRLRRLGLSPAQVKSVLRAAQGQTVPLALAPGLALHVDLGSLDPGLDPAAVARRVEEILTELKTSLKPEKSSLADAA